jgi:aminoglycoside phosphotransferase (APT) family kinase protein
MGRLYTHVLDPHEMSDSDRSVDLDWMGWCADTFTRDAAGGGSVVSPYLTKGPSPAEAEELAAYCYMKGIKLRVKYDGTGSYCRRTTFVHEAPVNALSYIFGRDELVIATSRS